VLGRSNIGVRDGGVFSVQRRRGARMILAYQGSAMITGRRRRILARETVARTDQADDPGDDRAQERQQNDGFVHLSPYRP
jgi:hypothetical protein